MFFVCILIALVSYAILDHWVGGARLFRGETSAIAANLFEETKGKYGRRVWYWDKRWVPYTLFVLHTTACTSALVGLSYISILKIVFVCGVYFWFRGMSPRPLFKAADGATKEIRMQAIKDGMIIGLKGFAPVLLRAYDQPWLLLTIVFALPLGLYHNFVKDIKSFRSYAELIQGGFIVGPFVLLNILY